MVDVTLKTKIVKKIRKLEEKIEINNDILEDPFDKEEEKELIEQNDEFKKEIKELITQFNFQIAKYIKFAKNEVEKENPLTFMIVKDFLEKYIPEMEGYIEKYSASEDSEVEETADDNSAVDTSFTQLAEDIKNCGGVLELTHDYTYDPTKDKYYKEGINITSDLIINGNNYIIDGRYLDYDLAEHSARAFNIISGKVILKDIIIKNCSNSSDGGAICMNKGRLNVAGSRFINCSSSCMGGAIYNDGGSLNVTGSKFLNCSSAFEGGAIYNNGRLFCRESTFKNCEIHTFQGRERCEDCTFESAKGEE